MNDPHVSGTPRPAATVPPGIHPVNPSRLPAATPGVLPKVAGIPTINRAKEDLSSIAIVDTPGVNEATPSKIKAFGVKEMASDREYKRQSNLSGNGAVHVRTFHGRLSDEGLQFIDDKINQWLEAHPGVEVKFATSTIGLFDGKIKDLALIVNVWY